MGKGKISSSFRIMEHELYSDMKAESDSPEQYRITYNCMAIWTALKSIICPFTCALESSQPWWRCLPPNWDIVSILLRTTWNLWTLWPLGRQKNNSLPFKQFAADVQFGGFEVKYIYGPSKSIGPRHEDIRVMFYWSQPGARLGLQGLTLDAEFFLIFATCS